MTHVSEQGVPFISTFLLLKTNLLPQKAVGLLHDTELVVRTFQRAHRWRTAGQVRGEPQPATQLRVPTDPVAPGLWMMSVAEQTGPFGTTSDENNPSCHPCTDTAPLGLTCPRKSQRMVVLCRSHGVAICSRVSSRAMCLRRSCQARRCRPGSGSS